MTARAELSPCLLKHSVSAEGMLGGSEAAKAVVREHSPIRPGTARGEPTFVGGTSTTVVSHR